MTINPTVNNTLTAGELNLAKKYKDYLDYNDTIMRLKQGERSVDINVHLTQSKQNPNRFDDVFKTMGIIRLDPNNLFADITQKPAYSLPQQDFSINRADNSFTFGVGSKISVGNYYLQVFDNIVGSFPSDYKANPQDATDGIRILSAAGSKPKGNEATALEEIISAVQSGNANFGNNMSMNSDILAFLNKIGIDTGKDFKINGVCFEVVNGVVQTKGYTAPKQEATGQSYLNTLLAKAYEQHLI